MVCHRLNGAGDAELGPDLNIPHSPTEYFGGDFLRQYIRAPQSLRRWPQARMPGFSEKVWRQWSS
ncbi:Cytochrome c, mono-and diheme variants (fragment) [Pseudomonas sp. 8Z]